MTDQSEPELNSMEKLLLETARIPWKELQYFFAAGHAVYVCADLDLVSVAHHIANDDKEIVAGWMESGKLDNVTNDQARDWYENNSLVWAVVVKPWVLVQDDTQSLKQ
jgi:hypothetical protein